MTDSEGCINAIANAVERAFIVSSLGLLAYLGFGTVEPYVYERHMRSLDYRQVMAEVRTFDEKKRYLTSYLHYETDLQNFGVKDYYASFREIHAHRTDDCDGGALSAAALSEGQYSPLMLVMCRDSNRDSKCHAVFPFKDDGKWGSLGINLADCIPPTYPTIDGLVQRLGYSLDNYRVYDIAAAYPDWIDNDLNMSDLAQPRFSVLEK